MADGIERVLGPLTSRLIAVSASEAKLVRQNRLVRPERIVLVPNGIDLTTPSTADTDLRQTLGLAPGTPLVGMIARLVWQKAPEEFVSVCAAISRQRRDVHFLMVGMGPLQDVVDAQVARVALGDRWHQIKYLASASSTLSQFDVCILTSRFEGGPYFPLEAMRANTPVVLSNVVGNCDVVEDGVSGILAPFGDAEVMAGAVVKLLDDPRWRQAMVDAAWQRLRDRFNVETMGAALSSLYREVDYESRRRRTRRLPDPSASSSTHWPESRAPQYSS
jgi:glycosyltransferase involved in cell wall biosynthesis